MAELPYSDEPPFDPKSWLRSFAEIGGGYALTAGRKLCFVVDECDGVDLAASMAQLVGRPDRQEAVKSAIEARQLRELSA